MKKYFFILAAVCAAMVACNKNETSVETPEVSTPVKMTLTATIGADTKIAYVDENNVLKAEWELYDKVSLLALDESGNLISKTNFTAQNAGKTAIFEGEFTNDPSIAQLVVCYPALLEGEGTAENPYKSPVENGYSPYGPLYGAKIGEPFISLRSAYFLQKNNADPSHISQYAVMRGEAEVEGDKLNVVLEHQSFVIKTTLTLPETGYDVRYMHLYSYDKDDLQANITNAGWQYIKDFVVYQNAFSSLTMCFGDTVEGGSGTGWTLDGNTMTVYLIGYGEIQINEGHYWTISLPSYLGDEYSELVGKKTFDAAKTLEKGKMYRLNLALEPLM
ncbi:MAG: hypothetical protein IKY95_01550 [Bacteroidales bacterium]|nr:hypothetical protein [Bacteroidales bacterium]